MTYQTKCTWAEVRDFQLYQENPSEIGAFVQALPGRKKLHFINLSLIGKHGNLNANQQNKQPVRANGTISCLSKSHLKPAQSQPKNKKDRPKVGFRREKDGVSLKLLFLFLCIFFRQDRSELREEKPDRKPVP